MTALVYGKCRFTMAARFIEGYIQMLALKSQFWKSRALKLLENPLRNRQPQ